MDGGRVSGPKLLSVQEAHTSPIPTPGKERGLNRTQIKKIIGTTGAVVGTVSTWLLSNHAALIALFPHYGTQIAFTTSLLSLAATWWGKHPGSSPSIKDAVIDGQLPAAAVTDSTAQ